MSGACYVFFSEKMVIRFYGVLSSKLLPVINRDVVWCTLIILDATLILLKHE